MSGWREQGFGIGPISHQEILAWTILYQVEVSPSEVEALKLIDIAYRNHEAEKAEQQRSISGEASARPKAPQSISASAPETADDIERAKRVLAKHKAKNKESTPHG